MAETANGLHPCACGCGELVRGTFKRGHASRLRSSISDRSGRNSSSKVAPMPPPGSDFDALAAAAEPFGDTVDIDAAHTPPTASEPPSSGQQPTPLVRVTDQEEDGGGPEGPDEPPAHAREPRRRRAREERDTAAGPRKIPRVTVATRTDIEGKISFALEIPGRVWQARDPICGTTFVEQRPEIASALTEIVCQSPDLINWFTGAGGQFMLWLNLAAACWPVATMAMAHHVYHTVALEPAEGQPGYGPVQQPDYSRYAA